MKRVKNKTNKINLKVENKLKENQKFITEREKFIKSFNELKEQLPELEKRFSPAVLQSEIVAAYRDSVKKLIETNQKYISYLEEINNKGSEEAMVIIEFLLDIIKNLEEKEISYEQENFLELRKKKLEKITANNKYWKLKKLLGKKGEKK